MRAALVAVYDRVLLVAVTVLILFLITLKSLLGRVRMSHENGVAARGRLRIVDNPQFPLDDFFVPDRVFPCRFRHASVTYDDDARLEVRSASIKFADADFDSPLDIKMNTGEAGPFQNAWSFLQFMYPTTRHYGRFVLPYYKKYPQLGPSSAQAFRYPNTFTQLYYYSQTAMEYWARDGKLRYIKFRLQPENRGEDTGHATRDELWSMKDELPLMFEQPLRPREYRSRNYLKEEFEHRLKHHGPVRYHLQLQLHEHKEGESRDVLNAEQPWDEKTHPWMDLAEVEVTEALGYSAGQYLWFHIGNHPPSMSIVKARSIHDPASLNYLRNCNIWSKHARIFAYRARSFAYRLFNPIPGKPTDFVYRFRGLPKPIPGSPTDFDYRLRGLPKPIPGKPTDVDYRSRGLPKPNPDTRTASEPEGGPPNPLCLPQQDSEEGRDRRRLELEEKRGIYEWERPAHAPSHVKRLPKGEKFGAAKMWRMVTSAIGFILLGSISAARWLLNFGPHLKKYNVFYTTRPKPPAAVHFQEDIEFARQRLAGVNPMTIQRCDKIPRNFAVNDAAVKGLLRQGETLESAIADRRLYLLDYAILESIKVTNGRFLAAPLCLLYRDQYDRLLPIAIQLKQHPDDSNPVFTAKDDAWLWLMVQRYVQSADAHVHEVIHHLLHTHLMMETFAVATARNLSARHPLQQLLTPHFRYTMAINDAARRKLLAPGGAIDKTMAAGYEGSAELLGLAYDRWSFDQLDPEEDLQRRRLDDDKALPNYPYRDDMRLIWDAIVQFVSRFVDYFYPDDRAVVDDEELKEWTKDLISPQGGRVRGLADPAGIIQTRAELKRIVARLIYTSSAGHAAVNNGQYDIYGYVPNAPGALYTPPPATKFPLSEKDLVEALPGFWKSVQSRIMLYTLSEPTMTPLGTYAGSSFAGLPPVWEMIGAFRTELAKVEEQIRQRNQCRAVPYTYLLPHQVPERIAI